MQVQFRLATDEQSGMLRMLVRTNPESNGHYKFEITVVALVANLTGRGRFGPLWLHPFNFVAAVAGGSSLRPPERAAQARTPKKPAAKHPRSRGK